MHVGVLVALVPLDALSHLCNVMLCPLLAVPLCPSSCMPGRLVMPQLADVSVVIQSVLLECIECRAQVSCLRAAPCSGEMGTSLTVQRLFLQVLAAWASSDHVVSSRAIR